LPGPRRRRKAGRVEIWFDIIKFGLIFGALATIPIVTWFAVAWLVTERKRSTDRRG
jgi:hypothetical protein